MTKLRNAALAGVLALGIGGAGVLAAAPAYAAPSASYDGGTLNSQTGPAGTDLDLSFNGNLWKFSEGVRDTFMHITIPEGTRFINSFNGVPSATSWTIIDGHLWNLVPTADPRVWDLHYAETQAYAYDVTDFRAPTLKLSQVTPGALQGSVTVDLVRLHDVNGYTYITDEVQPPSATFTWTVDQVDTPVIAPAIGGAAAVAGIGLAGIVLIRRRRAAQA